MAKQNNAIKLKIIEIRNGQETQDSSCVFGIFGIVYNGKIIAEHMISNKLFTNIMNKVLKDQ